MDSFGWDSRPEVRTDGVVTEPVERDLVVYDRVNQTAHSLSPEAAVVWERCDGRLSQREIASELKVPVEVVEQAVREFSASGLLTEKNGITRRDAGKRFAAVGGAALAAPLLYSVAVPSAALAQTGGCGTLTIDQADWNQPNGTTTNWVFFYSYLEINTTGATSPLEIVLNGGNVNYVTCAGNVCHPCTEQVHQITDQNGNSLADAIIQFSSTATVSTTYYAPGSIPAQYGGNGAHPNGLWVSTSPFGNTNIFLSGLTITNAEATTITNAFAACGKDIRWTLPLSGTVGTPQFTPHIVSGGFCGTSFGLAACSDIPTYSDLNVTTEGSGADAGVPTHSGSEVKPGAGGSNGSGGSGPKCLFAYSTG